MTNVFPLVNAGLSRGDCVRVIQEAELPVPKKSACVFCPYHDDRYWAEMQATYPEEFARAVAFDQAIRDMSNTGVAQPVFLHRSLQPLAEIDLASRGALTVLNQFNNECEGVCGV